MSSEIPKPIFFVGTGRSGSTVFFDIFTRHPRVAWLSWLADEYPDRVSLHRLLMLLRSNAMGDTILGKHFGPSEAYGFWENVCPGFSNPYRDLLDSDVTTISAARVIDTINRIVNRTRYRFVAKITGWPRVRLLRAIFPQALFIEVTRDPCATASSLLDVPFWDGWRGPPNWRRGTLPPDLDAIWRQESQSFVALAAIEYVIVQRAMAECRSTLHAEQIHTVSYSQLCSDPVGVYQIALDFCRLDWCERFEREIKRVELVNRDDQWRRKLTAAQQAVLQRTLERALQSRSNPELLP